MKTFTKAIALVIFSLPLLANAAGKTASAAMQVSFEVKESCNVQAAAKDAKASPAVACQLNTPYQMARNTAAASATSSTAPSTAARQDATSGDWTITF